MTKIQPCVNNCKHAYQDERYGPGKRVHNARPAGKGQSPTWACTVCNAGGRLKK